MLTSREVVAAREPNVPADLLRAQYGNVTKPASGLLDQHDFRLAPLAQQIQGHVWSMAMEFEIDA